MKGETVLIDADGNIDAPITTTNLTTSGNTTIGDSSSDSLIVTAKITGDLYWNDSASADKTIKAHNHNSTSTTNAEFKYDSDITSGATYGVWSDNNIGTTGTASATAILGVATVETGVTATGSTVIGTYGQARADGTVAGSAQMAGLYGLVGASAAITATLVCSAWLDSHQANAVTGSHQLLRMTNNGAAVMDEVMYIYGNDAITALMSIDAASGMVADTATTAGASKKIKINIDGSVFYMNAYAGA